mmetsp:Transcript_23064/g.41166  ORF Transcript_23064/g.41166 Transcript_23064/m.41166 type:complete len:243 (-) Transcript_23064:991-1719(-)
MLTLLSNREVQWIERFLRFHVNSVLRSPHIVIACTGVSIATVRPKGPEQEIVRPTTYIPSINWQTKFNQLADSLKGRPFLRNFVPATLQEILYLKWPNLENFRAISFHDHMLVMFFTCVVLKCIFQTQHFPHQYPERVHIGAQSVWHYLSHFWSHITPGSCDTISTIFILALAVNGFQFLRKAEVKYFDIASNIKSNVRWFDITMQYSEIDESVNIKVVLYVSKRVGDRVRYIYALSVHHLV